VATPVATAAPVAAEDQGKRESGSQLTLSL
jgi:hypothetical protein